MMAPRIRKLLPSLVGLSLAWALFYLASLVFAYNHPQTTQACGDCHLARNAQAPVVNLRGKFVHQPVRENKCTACHESATGGPTVRDESLCSRCHDPRQWANKQFRHPGREGTTNYCLSCHDQHSSDFEHLLKQDPIGLCQSCHKETKEYRSHPVGPNVRDKLKNRSMTCTSSCHNLHGADDRNLLPVKVPLLCLKCHEDVLRE